MYTKLPVISVIVLAAAALLAACGGMFLADSSGSGTVVFTLPGAGALLLDSDQFGAYTSALRYRITMSGPGPRTELSAAAGETVSFDLAAGEWTVSASAIDPSENITVGESSTRITVSAGKTEQKALSIIIYQIARNWTELGSLISGASGGKANIVLAPGTWALTLSDTAINITKNINIAVFEGETILKRADSSPFTDSFFTVGSGGKLTLGTESGMGGKLVLDGNKTGGASSGANSMIVVGASNQSYGELTLNDKVSIRNNDGTTASAILNFGTFTMRGGSISGCSNASSNGAGVTNGDNASNTGGTFTMTGGEITECSSGTSSGGGVLTFKTFIMSGTAKIHHNTAGPGAGVQVNAGTFDISGDAEISDNTGSSSGGGGVNVQGSSSVTMTGGSILRNTGAEGGGIAFTRGTFKMSAGTISGNISNGAGGGVAIVSGAKFNMEGGTISGNKAGSNGGGVEVGSSSSTLIMKGGTISGNEAGLNGTGSGGGVYISGGIVLMQNGSVIKGNTAASLGGGVYVASNYFYMQDGTVYGATGDANANRSTSDANASAALYSDSSTPPQYGTWTDNDNGIIDSGEFDGTDLPFEGSKDIDTTLRVVNGDLQ